MIFLYIWCYLFFKIGLKREFLGSCVRVNNGCSLIVLLRFWFVKYFMKVVDKRLSVVYYYLYVLLFVRGILGDFFFIVVLLFIV